MINDISKKYSPYKLSQRTQLSVSLLHSIAFNEVKETIEKKNLDWIQSEENKSLAEQGLPTADNETDDKVVLGRILRLRAEASLLKSRLSEAAQIELMHAATTIWIQENKEIEEESENMLIRRTPLLIVEKEEES